MKKKLLKLSLLLLSIVIVSEIILRFGVDIGDRPLYDEDEWCEYKLQKNQNITRFHNTYQTNEYGMRSHAVSQKDKRRILLFGDSVLNGGSKVDQEDLMSSVLEKKINNLYESQIGVYNISAGSWGPENAYNFLEHYVDFKLDMIVLVFSSHDYHDNMHHRKVVGEQPAWPNKQSLTAIGDLWSNFLIPKIKDVFGSRYDYLEGFDDSAVNPGWDKFINYAKTNDVPLVVYHHLDIQELQTGELFESGIQLKEKIISNEVTYLSGFDVEEESYYLDNIHLNSEGHQKISSCLEKQILMEDF